jgi:5,10-methylenetetrahydromethanopterin reductase
MYLGQQPHVGKASGLPEAYVTSLTEAMGGWPLRPGGVEAAMQLVGDDVVDRLTVAGTPDDVRRRGRQYLDAGASSIVPLVVSDDVPAVVAAFATL